MFRVHALHLAERLSIAIVTSYFPSALRIMASNFCCNLSTAADVNMALRPWASRGRRWTNNRVIVLLSRPSRRAISLGLSPSSKYHLLAMVASVEVILAQPDSGDEWRAEGRGDSAFLLGDALRDNRCELATMVHAHAPTHDGPSCTGARSGAAAMCARERM